MSRKARLILIALAMGGLMAIPISAIGAVSLWDDVPDESIFVNDTNWMKITEVSLGCNPPLNTEYCPKEFMTREQMAALLRRLSQGQIVNAATAIDSDKLDGRDAEELASITSAVTAGDVLHDSDINNPLVLAELSDFPVPADGGVITVHVNAVATRQLGGAANSEFGIVWSQIGGDCSLPGPKGRVGFYSTFVDPNPDNQDPVAVSVSALSAASVSEGEVDIAICSAGLPSPGGRTVFDVHASATWVPENGGLALADSSGVTWQEILAPFAGMRDG
ncbi:MAG: hypothetical protein QNJ71_07380 [Acidimicrobiia bacterium]|nr:hypothetical protein [Acidimicrobiia bacterium]